MGRERVALGAPHLKYASTAVSLPVVAASAFGAVPRLPLVPREPVRRLPLDHPHGLRAIAPRRPLHVVHGRPAAEVLLVHLIRALGPRGLALSLAASRCLAHLRPRVEPLGTGSEVDGSSRILVLRLGLTGDDHRSPAAATSSGRRPTGERRAEIREGLAGEHARRHCRRSAGWIVEGEKVLGCRRVSRDVSPPKSVWLVE